MPRSASRNRFVWQKKVPSDWELYSPMGRPIDNTRIITFKTPLRAVLCRKLAADVEHFTVEDLIGRVPDLGLVIDLTKMDVQNRYDVNELLTAGIHYKKIRCEGNGTLPEPRKVKKFLKTIDNFLKRNDNKLVGVHCTHGLNRTGLMTCKYLIEKLKFDPEEAITKFEEARGHRIERITYIDELVGRNKKDSFRKKSGERDASDTIEGNAKRPKRGNKSITGRSDVDLDWRNSAGRDALRKKSDQKAQIYKDPRATSSSKSHLSGDMQMTSQCNSFGGSDKLIYQGSHHRNPTSSTRLIDNCKSFNNNTEIDPQSFDPWANRTRYLGHTNANMNRNDNSFAPRYGQQTLRNRPFNGFY